MPTDDAPETGPFTPLSRGTPPYVCALRENSLNVEPVLTPACLLVADAGTGIPGILPAPATSRLDCEDFLSSPGAASPNAYDDVILACAREGVSPFSLLKRCALVLRPNGALVLADSHAAHDPVQRRHDHYLMALATHYGFTPAPPTPDGWLSARLTGAPRWQLDEPDPEDIGCMQLFQRAFGSEISPELWRWKYGVGRGRAVLARRGDRVIAHYAGTSRRVLFVNREVNALQVCDVMVDPGERAVMTRNGAFFEVASAWLEAHFGYYDDHLLAFGFPNHRAMRLGAKLGLYKEVGRIAELGWTPLEPKQGLSSYPVTLNPERDHSHLFEHLWSAMARDFADRVLVIRNPEYLRYRYQENPQHRYELIAVLQRLTGRPLALVVLRRETEFVRLVDYVGPLRELPRAIAYARRMTGHWGLPRLTGWIGASDVERFAATGAEVASTDVCVPCNVWSEGPPADELENRWWLMMGDTEFL